MEPPTNPVMIPSDQVIGNFPPNASFNQASLSPTKTRTNPKPYFRK